MYGFALWTAAPKCAGGAGPAQPTRNKGSNSNSASGNRSNSSACGSERCDEDVVGVPRTSARTVPRQSYVSAAKPPPTAAPSRNLGSVSPRGRALTGRTKQGTQPCEADGVPKMEGVRRGAAFSAVTLGSPLFRKAAAGGSCLKKHPVRGHVTSSRSIPPLQGEHVHRKEGTTADEESSGTLLVPLFKPDHTQDGPACACLQALEPYTVLCCSAGAYAGNYFYISKDPHGEILGGGLHVAPPALAMPVVSAGQQGPQQQQGEANVRDVRDQSSQEENPAVKALAGTLQGQEHHPAAPDGPIAGPHARVAQRQGIAQELPTADQQEKGQPQQVAEQPNKQTGSQANTKERPETNPLWGPQEPGGADQEAELHKQRERHQQGRSGSPCAEAEQRSRGDKMQRIRRPEQQQNEVPQRGSMQLLKISHSTAEKGSDYRQRQEGTDEQRYRKEASLMEEQTTACNAGEQEVEGFKLDDVTMRIEHAGLSAVHARIWEDPERKHLEDRLNIQDLASEEGTWKKVRWDRPIPVCRGSSSPRSTISSDSDATSVTSDKLSDDRESQKGGRGGGGEEGEEPTGRVHGEETASDVYAGQAGGEAANVTVEKAAAPAVMVSEVDSEDTYAGEGGRKCEIADRREQRKNRAAMPIGTLRCHTSVSEEGEHVKAGRLRDADASPTRTALSRSQHATPSVSDSLIQREQQKRNHSSKSGSPVRFQRRQQRHQQDMRQPIEREMEQGQPDQGQNQHSQWHAGKHQQDITHQNCEDPRVRHDRQRWPANEGQHEEGLSPVGGDERVKTRKSSPQLVNFSGRLLRFERGPPLPPSEAFDEFLLTFELLHLKSLLLACLRQRGCCCSRARRRKSEATAAAAPRSLSIARIRTRAGAGGLHAVAPSATREEATGAGKAKVADVSDTEDIRASSAGFGGGIKADSATLRANSVALPEASRRREGFNRWSRLKAISRIRRDKVFPMQAGATHSCEDCPSKREGTRGGRVRRWASLATARSRACNERERMCVDRMFSAEEASEFCQLSENTTGIMGSIIHRGSVRGDEENDGKYSDDAHSEACGEACGDSFRSDVQATKRARSYSRNIWWRNRLGAVGVRGGEATKRKDGARSETNWAQAVCTWQREKSRCLCRTCEANPLRWLWRTGPLSLLYQGGSGSDPRGRTTAGDGTLSVGAADATIETEVTATGLGTANTGMPAAVGATGRVAKYRADCSKDTGSQKRLALLPETSMSQKLGKDNSFQAEANKPHLPLRLLLTPEEADRWRMACVELPRHFLPVSKKSRPLTIYDVATGSKLGEVRWSGCYLVSHQQGHACVDGTGKDLLSSRGAVPEVAASAATIAQAGAALQQPTGRSLAAGADQQGERHQPHLEKPFLCQREQQEGQLQHCQQRQPGLTQLESIICDYHSVVPEHSDERVRFSHPPAGGSSCESITAQAADSIIPRHLSAPGSSSQAHRDSAKFLTPSLAPQVHKCSCRGGKECRQLDAQGEIQAACSENMRIGSRLNRNVCRCSFACSGSRVSTSMNLGLVLGPQAGVSPGAHTADAPGGNMSLIECALHSDQGSQTGQRYNEGTPGEKSSSLKAPSLGTASGSQVGSKILDTKWSSVADPLEDCDCWLVSSVGAQEDMRPWRASFASSPPKPTKGAGVAADGCKGERPPSPRCAPVSTRGAGGGIAAAGVAVGEAAPHVGEETLAAVLRKPAGVGGSPALSTATSRITSAAKSSEAVGIRRTRMQAAAPRLQTSAQGGRQRSASENQRQNTEEHATHGDDAPVEAVVQRLRTSSVSTLLHGRLLNKNLCGSARFEPLRVNRCSATEAPEYHETISGSSNIQAHSTVASITADCEVGGIPRIEPGGQKTLEKPHHKDAFPQSQNLSEEPARAGTVRSGQQQRESDGSQRVNVSHIVGDFMREPLSLCILPSSSAAAVGTPVKPVRTGWAAHCTRAGWSDDVDGLLHWTSSRRHSSNPQENISTQCSESTVDLPSSRNLSCLCSQGRELSLEGTYSGTAPTVIPLSMSNFGSGGGCIPNILKCNTLHGTSIVRQEYPVFAKPDELQTPAGGPFSSNNRRSPYSRSRTLRSPFLTPAVPCVLSHQSVDRTEPVQMNSVRHVTSKSAGGTTACLASGAESSHLGSRHATSRRSLAAAAAAPVLAMVRSAAAAMAAVAPAVLTAVSGGRAAFSPAVQMAPLGTSGVASASPAADSSTASLAFTSSDPRPSLLGAKSHTTGPMEDSDAKSTIYAVASGGGTCADGTPTACRTVANRCPANDGCAAATISAAAESLFKMSTSFMSVVPGAPNGACFHDGTGTVGSVSTHDGSPTSPVVKGRADTTVPSTTSFTASAVGAAADAVHPASMCRYPLRAHTHAIGATVAGAIRSSIRRRRNSFCGREGIACHFPLLAPARAASCSSDLPFPVETSRAFHGTPSQSTPAATAAAQVQRQNRRGMSLPYWCDALQVLSRAGPRREDVAAPSARPTSLLHDTPPASTVVQASAAAAESAGLPVIIREHIFGISNVKQQAMASLACEQSLSAELLLDTVAVREDSTAIDRAQHNSDVQLVRQSGNQRATHAVTAEQNSTHKGSRATENELRERKDIVRREGAELRGTGSGDDNNIGTFKESIYHRDHSDGSVLAQTETSLDVSKRTTRLPCTCVVHGPAFDCPAATRPQRTGTDQCSNRVCVSRSAQRRGCKVNLAHNIDAAKVQAAQTAVVEGGCVLTDCSGTELQVGDTKVCCSCERGSDVSACEVQERAPFACRSGSPRPSAATAAAVACTGILAQPSLGAGVHNSTRGKQVVVTFQTKRTQQTAHESPSCFGAGEATEGTESLPALQKVSDEKLHVRSGDGNEADDEVAQCKSAFCPTLSCDKDLQDDWSATRSLVHEARHRTSPKASSSDGSECSSGVEDYGRVEPERQTSTLCSSTKPDLSAVKPDEQIEENQPRRYQVDVVPRTEKGSNISEHLSTFLETPGCAISCKSSRRDLLQECAHAVSQPVSVSEGENTVEQVQFHKDSGCLQRQVTLEEQPRLSVPVTTPVPHTSAKEPVFSRGASHQRKSGSTAGKRKSLIPPVNAAGQSPSSKDGAEALLRAQHQVKQGAAAGGSTNPEGVAEHQESGLLSKTEDGDVLQVTLDLMKHHVVDFSEKLREGQSPQLSQQDRYEAKGTVVHNDEWGVGSDRSTGRENRNSRSNEEVILKGRCSIPFIPLPTGRLDGISPTKGTSEAKGEVMRTLLLGSDSKVKALPTPPLQEQWTDEDRILQRQGEAASAAALGHGSPSTSMERNLAKQQSGEYSAQRRMRAGGSLATQHRLKPFPTPLSECRSEGNADGSRSEQPAFMSATRKFFSCVARSSTPSAHPGDGEDRVRTRLPDCVPVSEGRATVTAASSDSNQRPALAAEVTLSYTARVARSASRCRNDSATAEPNAFLQDSLQLESEGNAQDGGPTFRREEADKHHHMEVGGQPVEAPRVAKNAQTEGGVTTFPQLNSCASPSQGEARNGLAVDGLVRLEGDCMPKTGTDIAADVAIAKLNQLQQRCARQPHDAKRGWVKRTEGRCTGALSALQVAAAAQNVATRKKVAASLIRRQGSAPEEVSSATSTEVKPVGGTRSAADEEASGRKRGGKVKFFPYRKCEGKKGEACQYREADCIGCNEAGQISGSLSRCNCESYCSSSEVCLHNQKRSVPPSNDSRVEKYEQTQEQRERQEDVGDSKHVVKRGTDVGIPCDPSSLSNDLDQQEKNQTVLINDVLKGSAPGRMAKSTEDGEEACNAEMGLRMVHDNELRLLLQAQAYLLRQKPRRQGFPEFIIPAAADVEQHMYEPAKPPEKSTEASQGRTTHYCDANVSGPEHMRRTIKPCYAQSAAVEHRRGLIRERSACCVPSPPSATAHRTSHDGLQYCEAGTGRIKALQTSTRRLQKPLPVGEDEGECAAGDTCEAAGDKRSKKVLCVYAAGEFQLLLAEPEAEEAEACASEPVTAAGAMRAAGTYDHSISSCHWRTCSCWVRLQARQHYRLRPGDVLRVGPLLEFSLKRFLTGVASQQGYRLSMEDEEVVIQDLGVAEDVYCSFFAVYDGHGGRACAEFVKRVLHVTFRRELLRVCGGSLSMSSTVRQHVYQALLKSFLTTDAAFLCEQQRRKRTGLLSTSGCACVVVVILGGEVWCANCGDARAVLCRGGKAIELSSDHKPHRKDELQRIVAAGGFVRSKRVLGRLAVSRAFGDVDYKGARAHSTTVPGNAFAHSASTGSPVPFCSRTVPSGYELPEAASGASLNSSQLVVDVSRPLVTAVPEIRMQPLCEEDEFLLLACDGLFDVFTSQEAADFVREGLNRRLAEFKDPQVLVDALLYEAIEKRRSRDNVTAILVLFSPAGRSVALATGGTGTGNLTKELDHSY